MILGTVRIDTAAVMERGFKERQQYVMLELHDNGTVTWKQTYEDKEEN